jgi:plasmid stabilization system protein ParE
MAGADRLGAGLVMAAVVRAADQGRPDSPQLPGLEPCAAASDFSGEPNARRVNMPQGDKSKYTDKQKRKAEHIAEGYEDRGVGKKEAKARAYATVNKESGGGNKSGSGRGKKDSHESSSKGGRKGGSTSASRSAAAKKGWETRRRKGK